MFENVLRKVAEQAAEILRDEMKAHIRVLDPTKQYILFLPSSRFTDSDILELFADINVNIRVILTDKAELFEV